MPHSVNRFDNSSGGVEPPRPAERRFRHRAVQVVAVVALAVGLQLGATSSAFAIERVDCFSGPPVPITLIVHGVPRCFGGLVGYESIGLHVDDFSSGGYYVRVFFRSASVPGETLVVSFEPEEFSRLDVFVVGIEIVPPF